MYDRRKFLLGGGLVFLGATAGCTAPSTRKMLYRLNAEDIVRALGQEPPTPEEQQMAQTILSNSPKTTALAVAEYLEARGEQNQDGEFYNQAWKVRSNPLIIEFFTATQTSPSSDGVPWCAAFANWCLFRSGKQYTNTASSGSFRCGLGDTTTSPQAGDLVVFKDVGQDDVCSGTGHVGFFESNVDSTHIEVLGGNQGGGGNTPSRIKVSTFRTDSPSQPVVRYIDYASIPGL